MEIANPSFGPVPHRVPAPCQSVNDYKSFRYTLPRTPLLELYVYAIVGYAGFQRGNRGVEQLQSIAAYRASPALGAGGPRFKSGRPD